MKLSCFYPNIINDFEVKFVTTDISKIKKNSIFINIQNNDVSGIPKEYLTNVLIVNQTPILDTSYICLKTENILKDLTHIYNIFYNLEECSYKLIGILNDDFLNYNKILIDLFNKQKKIPILSNRVKIYTYEHIIRLANDYEEITLVHRCLDKKGYAQGVYNLLMHINEYIGVIRDVKEMKE